MLIVVVGLGLLVACSGSEGGSSASERFGIYQQGKEAELNGRWNGTLTGLDYTIVLNEGRVIENWLGNGSMSFHAYGESGYIGYYSFDGTAFEAAMNDSGPGAPIDHVTSRLNGTLSNGQLSGADNRGDSFKIAR
jgi:hypothetical protein